MHAWAALKPADIVQAARALRELLSGSKVDDEAQSAPPDDAPRAQKPLSQESGAAE